MSLELHTIKQASLYFEPNQYEKLKEKQVDFRKYGVTVRIKFIQDIMQYQYLDGAHITLFSEMFISQYSTVKVINAGVYLFSDFIPSLTQQLNIKLQKQYEVINTGEQKYNIKQRKEQVEVNNTKSVGKQNEHAKHEAFDMFKQQDLEQVAIQAQLMSAQQQQQQPKIPYVKSNKPSIKIVGVNTVQTSMDIHRWDILQEQLLQIAKHYKLTSIDQIPQQYDYIFFPINLSNNHWISVILNFKDNQIQYMDSLGGSCNQLIIHGIQGMLKKYLKYDRVMKIVEVSPRQGNGIDCGIFVLLSLLYTLQSKDYTYNQHIASEFRRFRLYNLALLGTQNILSKKIFEELLFE